MCDFCQGKPMPLERCSGKDDSAAPHTQNALMIFDGSIFVFEGSIALGYLDIKVCPICKEKLGSDSQIDDHKPEEVANEHADSETN